VFVWLLYLQTKYLLLLAFQRVLWTLLLWPTICRGRQACKHLLQQVRLHFHKTLEGRPWMTSHTQAVAYLTDIVMCKKYGHKRISKSKCCSKLARIIKLTIIWHDSKTVILCDVLFGRLRFTIQVSLVISDGYVNVKVISPSIKSKDFFLTICKFWSTKNKSKS